MNHLEHMQVELLAAASSEWTRDTQDSGPESYDCYRILCIAGGRGIMHVENRVVPLEAGVLCIVPGGTMHRIEILIDGPLQVKWCHFRMSFGDREIFSTLRLPYAVKPKDAREPERLIDRIAEAMLGNRLTAKLRIKAAMLELVSLYLESVPEGEEALELIPASPELEKIDTVIRYIEEHLGENLTVEELAKLVYLHPNYFIMFFKGMLGCSPIQYVNGRRMEIAKKLLMQSDGNISDAARRVGMKSYYFSRMFKAYTGVTPSRYRKLVGALVQQGTEDEDA
jgi:AraC-like DNA-binding protein